MSGKRIEYKKTIVFSSEDEKDLYEAITDLESSKIDMTPSALVTSLVERKYLPKDPDAELYCKRLYLMGKSGEKFFDIVGDIFVFLSGKTFEDSYEKNLCLFKYIYEIVKKDVAIIPAKYERMALYNELVDLGLVDKGIKQSNYLKALICPYFEYFDPHSLIEIFIDKWKKYNKSQECYMAMSYLCRMLPDDIGNTTTNRLKLIRLISTMSENWIFASD